MTKTPKITVITPTYNRANFIAETIESVLAQEFKDFEYFILDDGSTDNTEEIVKPYLKDKRIKYLKQKNKGEAETVNWGWSLAKGEYFTQVNSDDPILPGIFSEMVKVLDKRQDAVVAYPNFYFIDDNGNIIKEIISPDWNFIELLTNFSCHAASPGSFIRKSSFSKWKSIRDKRFKYINDTDMYWKMALEGDFIHVNKFLATWRDHQGGISAARINSIPEIQTWLNDFFQINNLPKEIIQRKSIIERNVHRYCLFLLESENVGDLNSEINKIKNSLGERQYKFRNLQVSDNDLIGNKFNGHNLHKELNDMDIESKQLVWAKESNDPNTFVIAGNKINRHKNRSNFIDIQLEYQLNNIFNPIILDILYNDLFLTSNVLHFHLMHNWLMDLNFLPILSRLKPLVWTLHDPWAFGGHCIHHFDCNKWMSHCFDCPFLNTHFSLTKDNSALNFAIKKQAIKNSDFDVIVASKWMYDKVKASPIFNDKPVHLVPFGIDQSIFRPKNKKLVRKNLGIPEDATVLLFRCDYSEFKGMNYIEYVLDHLDSSEKIAILTTAQKLKVKAKFPLFEFGWVKDDIKLSDIYNAADIFLAPSKVDAFGMMVVEAMSCGVLPIVTDGTALPETIDSPNHGVSTERSEKAYFKVVKDYIVNKKKLQQKQKKVVQFAKKKYNREKYIRSIIDVYTKAMSRHKLNPEDELLLRQLKKHVVVKPSTKDISLDRKFSTDHIQNPIAKLLIILFFKAVKIFPSKIRKKIKKVFSNITIIKFDIT